VINQLLDLSDVDFKRVSSWGATSVFGLSLVYYHHFYAWLSSNDADCAIFRNDCLNSLYYLLKDCLILMDVASIRWYPFLLPNF
jgi:hypothetical protein